MNTAMISSVATFVLILLAICIYQGVKADRFESLYNKCTAYSLDLQERVDEQNKAIDQMKLDTQRAEQWAVEQVQAITDNATAYRIHVVKELVKDNSCGNRLRLLEEQIQRFYE